AGGGGGGGRGSSGGRSRGSGPGQRVAAGAHGQEGHMSHSASIGGDTAADFETGGGGQTVAPAPYVLGDVPGPLGRDELRLIDAWWRAANYLAVGQIFLLRQPARRGAPGPAHHQTPPVW